MNVKDYRELLISRIKTEREVLKEIQNDFFVKHICDAESSLNTQNGYVAGLEHALRLLEPYMEEKHND